MKKELRVGPIQKNNPNSNINFKIRKQANAMKVGEFFKISGVNSTDASRLRAALYYYAKNNKVKLSTTLEKNVLTVERIKK